MFVVGIIVDYRTAELSRKSVGREPEEPARGPAAAGGYACLAGGSSFSTCVSGGRICEERKTR
jgi:hypothetical protein